jgi:hypothetical protein
MRRFESSRRSSPRPTGQGIVGRTSGRHHRTAAANAGWNYSTITGHSVRFDSSPCWRSLARAGLPVFHHPLSPRHKRKRMANAGKTTGSAPAARREVECSNHSLAPRSGVAQSSVVLPILVASRSDRANACGNTSGSQVVQIHPSIPGSIGFSHRLVARLWNAVES